MWNTWIHWTESGHPIVGGQVMTLPCGSKKSLGCEKCIKIENVTGGDNPHISLYSNGPHIENCNAAEKGFLKL